MFGAEKCQLSTEKLEIKRWVHAGCAARCVWRWPRCMPRRGQRWRLTSGAAEWCATPIHPELSLRAYGKRQRGETVVSGLTQVRSYELKRVAVEMLQGFCVWLVGKTASDASVRIVGAPAPTFMYKWLSML
jgi:hypothetical protein